MADITNISTVDALAVLFSKINNDETTVGKSGKTLFWSGLSVLLLALANAIIGNPTLFSWHSGIIVVVANVLLIFLKNIVDSSTPNV